MLDLHFIRDHADLVQKIATAKKVSVDLKEFISLDVSRREILEKLQKLQQERNVAAKEKNIARGKELKTGIVALENELKVVSARHEILWKKIPNIVTEDVPFGKDEGENVVLREVGEKPIFSFTPKQHFEIGKAAHALDTERSAQLSGARFAYLFGDFVKLQFALIQYTLSILTDEKLLGSLIAERKLSVPPKPFLPVIPPVLLKPEPYERMARLEPRDERYYIPSDDLYLIGSSEHVIGSFHMDETLSVADLPLRYVGYSTCFRREAGSYGKDLKGILRMHQFDKLEMESFAHPDFALEEHHFFIALQEYLVASLGLPYRVMLICTGDMGSPDARQVDIETWMPGQGRYRETHTADYMSDYQARRLNTRFRSAHSKESVFVHMNDATALALGRIMIAIVENYQQEDGSVLVPGVLKPYLYSASNKLFSR